MLVPVAVHQVAVEAGARVVELTRSKFQPELFLRLNSHFRQIW